LGPFFRAEESHTRRHLSEFTSIDIEQAFADAKDVMALLEQVIHHACIVVKEKCSSELKTLVYHFQVPELPFKRLTYTEVLESLKAHGVEIPWAKTSPQKLSVNLANSTPTSTSSQIGQHTPKPSTFNPAKIILKSAKVST